MNMDPNTLRAAIDSACDAFYGLARAVLGARDDEELDAVGQSARLRAASDQIATAAAEHDGPERVQLHRFTSLLESTITALDRYADDGNLPRLAGAVQTAMRDTGAAFGFADVPAGWETTDG